MSRIPAELAEKLDRLSYHAHRFHRFAHHPLCAEYAGELIRLGRQTRVCRGCALVAAGALLGGALALLFPARLLLAGSVLLGSMASLTLATFRRRPARAARPSKLASRFLPAIGVAYALGRALLEGGAGYAFVVGGGLALAVVAVLYRRRGPHRGPCDVCPERWQSQPCRGYLPIVRRERAFRRLASHWLVRAGL